MSFQPWVPSNVSLYPAENNRALTNHRRLSVTAPPARKHDPASGLPDTKTMPCQIGNLGKRLLRPNPVAGQARQRDWIASTRLA